MGAGGEGAAQKQIFNPKFLDWPSRGTPGSKWVSFMLPDADETDSSGWRGHTRLWHNYVRVDVAIYW